MSRSGNVEVRAQWRERHRRFARSGMSVAEFCRREQVSVASFYYWRRRLPDSAPDADVHRRPTGSVFIPIQVEHPSEVRITFPNGTRLTLPAGDRRLVRTCLKCLATARPIDGGA